jgi:hypothetical protein
MNNTLEKKLLIKPDKSVLVINPPTGFEITSKFQQKPVDVVITFVKRPLKAQKKMVCFGLLTLK